VGLCSQQPFWLDPERYGERFQSERGEASSVLRTGSGNTGIQGLIRLETPTV
jgi:hypothetical protein